MTNEELKALIEGISARNIGEWTFASASMEQRAYRRGFDAACEEILAHVSARESEEGEAALDRLKRRVKKMRERNAQMLDGGAIDAGSFEGYSAACDEILNAIREEEKE